MSALGRQVHARTAPPASAMVAVRMPRDLLARVEDFARLRNSTVSAVLREGAEQMVSGACDRSYYLSGAGHRYRVTVTSVGHLQLPLSEILGRQTMQLSVPDLKAAMDAELLGAATAAVCP